MKRMKGKMKKRSLLVALFLMAVLLFSLPCEAASATKLSRTKANLFTGETGKSWTDAEIYVLSSVCKADRNDQHQIQI